MRIVVSGTHASGKSTLISDFAARHPDFVVLPDPFDLIDEAWDGPSAAMFAAQLRVAADRLVSGEFGPDLIAERGPLDFLAYLVALREKTGAGMSSELLERSAIITAEALRHVDLLVVLPLTTSERFWVDADEDLELRDTMNDILLDLIEDPDLIGTHAEVVEIAGTRSERSSLLDSLVR
ncbi:AAA family ATPase [Microbacterium sp. SS28]|uniref:AAA family ATPase n=1 Tax=Microbacterium sp. SS28 TaxID=2919948 RepID=UPI001FA98F97|nr:AAA family ATPase [Microbacterium sp. SS28]